VLRLPVLLQPVSIDASLLRLDYTMPAYNAAARTALPLYLCCVNFRRWSLELHAFRVLMDEGFSAVSKQWAAIAPRTQCSGNRLLTPERGSSKSK
jgi:hypothetical protein